jgi:S1-C subfamily serine protease
MSKKYTIEEIAKISCPAVITIVASKDLPEIDGFYSLPYNNQNYIIPKIKGDKKIKTKVGGASGFLVSSDGYIITCNHVISDQEANYTAILEPTKKYPVKIMSRDSLNDIAILKIEGSSFPFLKLGNSSLIKLGEQVIAIGNPLGEFYDTVSAGIISGLSRLINTSNSEVEKTIRLKGLIQTDAAINPGNSGGPLINMENKVIGINTAIVSGAQNLGFAIPINYAIKDLQEVKKYGKIKRPFIGIKFINKEISEQNNLPVFCGALIIRERLGEEAVIPNSAAEKSGLKEFDIILEVNDQKITEDNYLSDILEKYEPGEKIEIKILRNKKILNLFLKLEEK